jgi:hypothetical protein
MSLEPGGQATESCDLPHFEVSSEERRAYSEMVHTEYRIELRHETAATYWIQTHRSLPHDLARWISQAHEIDLSWSVENEHSRILDYLYDPELMHLYIDDAEPLQEDILDADVERFFRSGPGSATIGPIKLQHQIRELLEDGKFCSKAVMTNAKRRGLSDSEAAIAVAWDQDPRANDQKPEETIAVLDGRILANAFKRRKLA